MKPKNVAIRTDASPTMGSGHVMRCMAIAQALQKADVNIHFICNEIIADLAIMITSAGHQLHKLQYLDKSEDLPSDTVSDEHGFLWQLDIDACLELSSALGPIDWLIIDHYGLDRRWQAQARTLCDKLLVIDDLANRQHDADILVDHNYGRTAADYQSLCPPQCKLLIGPTYGLLRNDFSRLRKQSLVQREQAKQPFKLLLSLGGGDNHQLTNRIIALLTQVDNNLISELVVVDPSNSDEGFNQAELDPNCKIKITHLGHTQELAQLMSSADLAIGAGGISNLERCSLGLPSLVLVLLDNQRPSTHKLVEHGHLFNSFKPEELTAADLTDFLSMDVKTYQYLSRRCSTITDGLGVQHVMEALEHDN